MAIQSDLGSDIAMVFDECLAHSATRDDVERSVFERTIPWELRSLACHPGGGRAVFAIVQGGLHDEIRARCADELVRHPFDGFAIGGLSVGEAHADFVRILDVTMPRLPAARPRYLMGVGSPRELIEAIDRGVDLFDCVLPTRNARNAQALTADGPVRMRAAAHAADAGPIEAGCDCEACAGGFSRAYVRHLFNAKEMIAATLVTAHNLRFLQRLMAGARDAITRDAYPAFRDGVLLRYPRHAGLADAP